MLNFTINVNNSKAEYDEASIQGILYLIMNLNTILPYTIINIIGTVTGLLGNLLIIASIILTKKLHTQTNFLIVNLAISDLMVSFLNESFTVAGVLLGKDYFHKSEKLCSFLASVCMINCITAILNMALLAFNRYIYILYNDSYLKYFNWRNTYIMCTFTWLFGIIVYTPNYFDSKYSVYDVKTLSCILNRTASKLYTVIFLSIVIIIPTLSVIFFYLNIFIKIIRNDINIAKLKIKHTVKYQKTIQVTKGLFISCIIFMICHLPFGLVILSDLDDKLPNLAYMYSMLIAHLGSSTNVFLYALTNSQLLVGYKNFFSFLICRKSLFSNMTNRSSFATFMD